VPLLKYGCIVLVLWRAVLISVSNISGLINKEAVFLNCICWCFLRCLHPPRYSLECKGLITKYGYKTLSLILASD
jgi:hypothetical protein